MLYKEQMGDGGGKVVRMQGWGWGGMVEVGGEEGHLCRHQTPYMVI